MKPPAPDRRRVQPWPGERVAAVREALPNRYAILVDMCAGLGLRHGEAFGLAVDDVDCLRSVVHVRWQVKILGSRQVFAPPKGGRIRDVPLPESVSLRLAAYLQAFGACEVMLPLQATGKPAAARLVLTTRERAAANRNYINAFRTEASTPAGRRPGNS